MEGTNNAQTITVQLFVIYFRKYENKPYISDNPMGEKDKNKHNKTIILNPRSYYIIKSLCWKNTTFTSPENEIDRYTSLESRSYKLPSA